MKMMEKRQPELIGPGSPVDVAAAGPREKEDSITSLNGCKADEGDSREAGEDFSRERGLKETEGEEEGEKGEGEVEGEGEDDDDDDDAPLQNSSHNGTIIIVNGVAKETASHDAALDPKREVPVIELSRRGAIKAPERRAEGHYSVPITELRRPPVPLPLPRRDDARMVQLSPTAFPLPARAMLYNLAQPLAAINRYTTSRDN
ncbi:hypothetical protein CRUP_018871 [Coryphaenoides rupestris]|nr:hypothetical protein CRUP_018871 [Coryphaenoides rupestris]